MPVKTRKSRHRILGKVNGGIIVPEPGTQLPEGASVRIELLKSRRERREPKIMRHAGVATSLPPDASRNVEHYLYGYPKR